MWKMKKKNLTKHRRKAKKVRDFRGLNRLKPTVSVVHIKIALVLMQQY